MARSVSSPPDLEDVVERVQAHRAELEAMGVRYLGVFGSVARGDARPDSDVDVLVECDGPGAEYLGAALEEYLVDILGRQVDAVPRDRVRSRIKNRVESEAIEVFPEFTGRHDMPPKQPREWRMYFEDMIQAAESILENTQGLSPEALGSNKSLLKAVAWDFQIMGEAIHNLPEGFRRAHREIAWSEIRALRNKIVHGYWDIDPVLICEAAQGRLPNDLVLLRHLLADES
ncbi:MAG: HepT-like ribonuclease domain-containing protein [Chloroflexota bacterium]